MAKTPQQTTVTETKTEEVITEATTNEEVTQTDQATVEQPKTETITLTKSEIEKLIDVKVSAALKEINAKTTKEEKKPEKPNKIW